MRNVTFNEVLEMIDSFSEEQRESILEIVKLRLVEERRDRLAQSIKEAREEYRRGEVKRGTAEDLMSEISE